MNQSQFKIHAACRTLVRSYGDRVEGSVGCLLPDESADDERFSIMEFVVEGRLVIESVPKCVLRQATETEAAAFVDAIWDVYDKIKWN